MEFPRFPLKSNFLVQVSLRRVKCLMRLSIRLDSVCAHPTRREHMPLFRPQVGLRAENLFRSRQLDAQRTTSPIRWCVALRRCILTAFTSLSSRNAFPNERTHVLTGYLTATSKQSRTNVSLCAVNPPFALRRLHAFWSDLFSFGRKIHLWPNAAFVLLCFSVRNRTGRDLGICH